MLTIIKVNDDLYNVLKDGEKVGYIVFKMKSSVFGGGKFSTIYDLNNRKLKFTSQHPTRTTDTLSVLFN